MNIKPVLKKRWIWIIVAALLVILVSLNFIVSMYVKRSLERFTGTGRYQLHMDKVSINLFTRSASVYGVMVQPNQIPDSVNRVQAAIKEICLTGIEWIPLIRKKSICAGEIRIIQAEVYLRSGNTSVQKRDSQNRVTLYNAIKNNYQEIRIGKLMVQDANIKLSAADSAGALTNIPSVDLEIQNLFADSTTAANHDLFTADNIQGTIKNLNGHFQKGLYRFSVPKIEFNHTDSLVKVDSLLLEPTVDQTQFGKRLGYQTDCLNLKIADILIHTNNLKMMVERQSVLIDSISIGYLKLRDYRDKNIPRKFEYHPLPKAALDSLSFKINIGKLNIADAEARYEELNEGAPQSGHISFDKIKAELTGLSNLTMKDTMKLRVTGVMMSQAALDIHLLFPLAKNEFYATATSGAWDMNVLNSMAKNFAPIEIVDGKAKSMKMNAVANETSGSGNMTFTFSDLAVRVTDKKKRDKNDPFKAIATFIANNMVLVRDNPENGSLRLGEVEFTRNPGRNVINYIWNLTFSGIKSSIGLKGEKTTTPVISSKNVKNKP